MLRIEEFVSLLPLERDAVFYAVSIHGPIPTKLETFNAMADAAVLDLVRFEKAASAPAVSRSLAMALCKLLTALRRPGFPLVPRAPYQACLALDAFASAPPIEIDLLNTNNRLIKRLVRAVVLTTSQFIQAEDRGEVMPDSSDLERPMQLPWPFSTSGISMQLREFAARIDAFGRQCLQEQRRRSAH